MHFSVFTRLNRFFLLLLACLTLCVSYPLAAAIEKSPNDPKSYQPLTLENGLQVLLISDPGADKAAAAMNVAVGSSANPEDRAGLAHFLEHMLFLGTEKYPKADEYQSFIRSHGGGHNAYTAMENTNYFFDVSAEHLEPALDRFAQFFIAPLFDSAYVDRERHAVHSEYQARIRDDHRRGYAATKAIMNPEHSHNRFAVGSLETLSDRKDSKIRDELIQFYQRYYSANLMSLVVQSPLPLEQIKALVVDRFSVIKNHNAAPYQETTSLFNARQLPQLLQITALKENRSLNLTFPVPAFRQHWEKKPLYYISSLIGYEGKGSLLSALKSKGWVTALAASPGHNLENEGSFMVNMQLTAEGLKHHLDISAMFFRYIELMKQEGIREALFQEEKQLSQLHFRFLEKTEPIHLVSNLARQMQRYPVEQVISADYTFREFSPQLISSYLEPIRPDNMLLTLSAPDLPTNQTESYYQTAFSIRELNAAELQQLSTSTAEKSLYIRGANPFIARNLQLQPGVEDNQKPKQISENSALSLWHQQDTSFSVPKANFYFSLQRPSVNHSARNWVLSNLYLDMVQETLNETLYDASLAGLGTRIYPHMKGFSIRLSGYNEKLPTLLDTVAQGLNTPHFTLQQFTVVKQRFQEALENARKDKPYNQTTNKLYELLLPQWSNEEQLSALSHIELYDLQKFVRELPAPGIRALAHGNLSRTEAKQLGEKLGQLFLSENSMLEQIEIPVVQLPADQQLQQDLAVEHNDSAISVLLQGESNSIQARAELALLSEILAAPFYNQLRTEKQLGYIVFATPLQMNKTPGLAFIVQSPSRSAIELQQHINQFVLEWNDKLSTLDESQLLRFKRSVIARIKQQDNKLSTRSNRFWRQLDWGDTDFDGRERLATAVEQLTLEQLEHCFIQLQKRRLNILSNGNPFQNEEQLQDKATERLLTLKEKQRFVPE